MTKKTNILLQGEAIPDIAFLTLDERPSVQDVLGAAAKLRSGAGDGDYLVFLEGEDEPLDTHGHLPKGKDGEPLRLQVHRCVKIAVAVTFNGVTKTEDFAPGRTVESVKKAMARAHGLDPRDAAEHVLQLAGSNDRPDADTHIGALVGHGACALAFDLVPLKRVEG